MASSTMRFLGWVERAGNRLPHPFWLFCWLLVAVGFVSAGLAALGVSVERPPANLLSTVEGPTRLDGRSFTTDATGKGPTLVLRDAARARFGNLWVEVHQDGRLVAEKKIEAARLAKLDLDRQLLPGLAPDTSYRAFVVNRPEIVALRSVVSKEGLRWFVTTLVDNFAHFAPLGLVLVMLMGVSVAEGAGLIATVMRGIALTVPRSLLTPVVFALAACGNIGSDAGVVVMPPLAAALFRQMGRSPIAGLIVGYVGATAGFTANLLPAGTDVLAMSLTNAATGGTPPVNVLSNWYFMAASVLVLSVVSTWVTKRFLLPRLEQSPPGDTSDGGSPPSDRAGAPESTTPLRPEEKRAAIYAGLAVLVTAALWLLTLLPEGAWLREDDPEPAMFWRSPFFRGLVPILFSLFTVGGVVYGKLAGTITKADDVLGFMAESMKRMGGYLVLVLAMAEFTALFQWVGLDVLLSVEGAQLLRAMGMESQPIPFFIAFITMVAFINLFLGSASAKWAILAPVFVPMFMGVGFHPAFTQLLYRVGDSITNCVSPLYPYFPILLEWVRAQDPRRAQVGTVLSYLMPYALFLFVTWLIMAVLWYLTGLPVGPDSPLRL